LTDRNIVVRMPSSVPPIVAQSFLSLVPLLALIVLFGSIRFALSVDLNDVVQTLFTPLVFALNTLPGILVYALVVTSLWAVGVNGDNTVDAVVAPIFLQYLAANANAMRAAHPPP